MKKQRRAPNPLRKWAGKVESFHVICGANGSFRIRTEYAEDVSRVPSDGRIWLSVGPRFPSVDEREQLSIDIERVLSKALREAKG